MITEHALLSVEPAQSDAFEVAMAKAHPIIARQPGFQGIELCRDLEAKGRYMLLVQWNDVESHRDGFRQSADYAEWKKLLHGFYDPLPDVRYFGESLFDD